VYIKGITIDAQWFEDVGGGVAEPPSSDGTLGVFL